MPAPKLRMVKVIVHPIFMLDDGETITEFQNQPTVVPAAEWPDFSNKLAKDTAEVQQQLDDEYAAREATKAAAAIKRRPKR